MKALKLLAVGIVLLVSSSIHAQVSVSVNIGTPPSWGPVGYAEVEYYYLPDVQAYYDIRASQFIYFGRGSWVRSRYLPRQYRNYDLYSGYKVVLNDYHGHRPYADFNYHRAKYHKGYRGQYQRSIGHRHDDYGYAEHRSYSNDRREHDNDREHNYHGDYDKHDNHGNKGHRKH